MKIAHLTVIYTLLVICIARNLIARPPLEDVTNHDLATLPLPFLLIRALWLPIMILSFAVLIHGFHLVRVKTFTTKIEAPPPPATDRQAA